MNENQVWSASDYLKLSFENWGWRTRMFRYWLPQPSTHLYIRPMGT